MQDDQIQTQSLPSAYQADKMELFTHRKWLKEISVKVYILVMLFAIASWIDINGLWVELPLLVSELPEGWKLPSYLSIIIQVANIGPIAYAVGNKVAPNKVKEWPVVYMIIIIGAVACLLLAFFWKHTAYVLNEERSVALIGLSALLALVDTTSSVVFLPYMVIFKPHYMSAFYIGEGLSGLVPGIVGLIQGLGANPDCKNVSVTIQNSSTGLNYTKYEIQAFYTPPLFSVELFFFFLCAMLCVSAISFTCLNFLPSCQKETVVSHSEDLKQVAYQKAQNKKDPIAVNGHVACGKSNDSNSSGSSHQVDGSEARLTDSATDQQLEGAERYVQDEPVTCQEIIYLLTISVWINALLNGVIPATQSYSSLPYSNTAYTLCVRLSTLANPLACFLALFFPSKSIKGTVVLVTLGTLAAVYQLYLAALSPYPPLQGTSAGEFCVISTAVLMTGFFSYTKVSIATILRDKGRKALLWCGMSQQIGSAFGAMIIFILINTYNVFKSAGPCDNV